MENQLWLYTQPAPFDPILLFFLELKNFLVGIGWTVLNSRADASNYGSGDYWTSLSAMVPLAWAHMRAPTGTQEIVVRSTHSSTWEYWIFSYSPTGFAYGGTTSPPTAPDVVEFGASRINAGGNWNGSTAAARICFSATDSPPYGFWVFGWFEATNTPFILFGLDTVDLYDPADNDPTVYFCANSSLLDNSTHRFSFMAAFSGDQIRCRAACFQGSALENIADLYTLAPFMNSNRYQTIPIPASPARQESLVLPVVYCNSTNGIKGKSIYLRQTFRTLTNGELFTMGSENYIFCGNTLFPWDGTVAIP